MFVQVLANLDGADTSNKYVSTKYDDVPSGEMVHRRCEVGN